MPGCRIGEASHPGPVDFSGNDKGRDLVEKWLHRDPAVKRPRTMADALGHSAAGSSSDPLPQVPPEPVPEAEQHPEPVQAEPVPEAEQHPEPVQAEPVLAEVARIP